MDNIFKLLGMPATIVSNQDPDYPVFTSNFLREIFKLQGTQLQVTSSYHSQSHGQIEVLNRFLDNYLCCYTGDHPKSLLGTVDSVSWMVVQYYLTTQVSPYQVVYGVAPTYHLNLSSKLHLFFHGSKLKKKLGQEVIPQPSLPPLNPDGSLNPYPSAILARRILKRGPTIFARGFCSLAWSPRLWCATWEKYCDLEARFPQFILEDKDRLRAKDWYNSLELHMHAWVLISSLAWLAWVFEYVLAVEAQEAQDWVSM